MVWSNRDGFGLNIRAKCEKTEQLKVCTRWSVEVTIENCGPRTWYFRSKVSTMLQKGCSSRINDCMRMNHQSSQEKWSTIC